MKLAMIAGLSFVAVAATAQRTSAVETFTPPLSNPGGEIFSCIVQNLGDSAVTVEAMVRNATMIECAEQAEVPAGTTMVVIETSQSVGIAYCGFTFDGDPANVRGYVQLSPAGGGDTLQLFGAFEPEAVPEAIYTTLTPPVRSLGAEAVACVVQNVADDAVLVETEIVDQDGMVVASSTNAVGAGGAVVPVLSSTDVLNAYCRFTFDGNPSEVRGYLRIQDIADSPVLQVPAAPPGVIGDTVIYTPPLSSPEGDATSCVVHNFGVTPVQVTAELIDSNGVILADNDASVDPDEVDSVTGSTEVVSQGFCRFTFDDEDGFARGYISRFPSGLFADTNFVAAATAAAGAGARDRRTYSPPVDTQDGLLQCALANLTAFSVDVHVEIEDGAGNIVTMADAMTQPGRAQVVLSSAQNLTGGFCTFAFDGRPESIRGFATLTNAAFNRSRLVLPASTIGPPSTPTPTATASPTDTEEPTATASPTDTEEPTATPTEEPTPTSTSRPTFTPTASPTDTAVPTATPTESPTETVTTEPTPTPTVEPTSTNTAEPTETPTTEPTSTPTEEPTLEPTATPVEPCVGDCDGDGMVTVDEILRMVNIALGAPIEECPAGDRDGDGDVTVDEILAAVANALDGCPMP